MIKGFFWFILSLLVSINNDSCVKLLTANFSSYQIVFIRSSFAVLFLLPFLNKIMMNNSTSQIFTTMFRGVLTCGAMILWNIGLSEENLFSATLIGFTIPFFVLLLSAFILKEQITSDKIITCVIAFMGILIGHFDGTSMKIVLNQYLIFGALSFALIDVLNKKYIRESSLISTMFFVFLGCFITSLIPTVVYWKPISLKDIFTLLVLSLGTILILYTLLKSFSLLQASTVAPLRFIELLFSSFYGFVLFDEIPSMWLIIGSVVILLSIIIYSTQQATKENIVN